MLVSTRRRFFSGVAACVAGAVAILGGKKAAGAALPRPPQMYTVRDGTFWYGHNYLVPDCRNGWHLLVRTDAGLYLARTGELGQVTSWEPLNGAPTSAADFENARQPYPEPFFPKSARAKYGLA